MERVYLERWTTKARVIPNKLVPSPAKFAGTSPDFKAIPSAPKMQAVLVTSREKTMAR